MSHDLAVAYRVYPGVSKRPFVHADDKYRLVELGLKSLKEGLGSLRTRVWALLDGCPPEYETLVRRYFPPADLEVVRLDGEGNLATFERQLAILTSQGAAEAVYLAEDDYLYLPGALEQMVAFLDGNADADFVSPYDHPDHYEGGVHPERMPLRVFGGRHWRGADSSCLTFLTRRETLAATRRVWSTYGRGNHDLSMGLALTKQVVRNPLRMTRLLASDPLMFRLALNSWWFSPAETLLGRRWSMWTPVPGLATHMESSRIAPGVDWEARVRTLEENPVEMPTLREPEAGWK